VLRVTNTDTQALCVHPVATGLPGRTQGAISTHASLLKQQHMQVDDSKGRTCNTWTAEEDAIILAHLRANSWSFSGFSGKHMFTVTQGAGGTQSGGGKRDVRQDACAESDTY
jgi:hypothetical protein